jgi:hypothetical protein
MPTERKRYTVAELEAMQGDAPLIVDAEWDAMPDAGQEAFNVPDEARARVAALVD